MTVLEYAASLVGGASWDHGGGWWFPFTLLSVAVLGAAVWFVARSVGRHERSGGERARDILAERYARGEIDGEEYRGRLDQLG